MTDPGLGRGRPLVEIVAAAVRGGVTLVQLRDKAADGRALLEQARALIALLGPLGVPLIVNDRVDVALAAGAAGCHVGQSDLPAAAARALLGPEAILGVSLDAVEQARAASTRPWSTTSPTARSPRRPPSPTPAPRSVLRARRGCAR